MILKGNQRGGGQQMAAHLMNAFDNERVEIADLRGAVADDLSGAFAEWAAEARGTKCQKFLYSLSLNPDQSQGHLTREQYLELLERTERSLKLVGQPRAVVFHEKRDKDGVLREHCHAVWSRIDTEKMKAVQIAHDRLKLRTVAREFARDHGLELPDGMKPGRSKDSSRDRFNNRAKEEKLQDRQQRERTGIPLEQHMADIATCWRETGNGAAFMQALEAKGYYLAHGDQRAYVVIDLHGEVHSLSRRLVGVAKAKELKDRLSGYPLEELPDVESAKAWAKQQRIEREKQIAEKQKPEQQEKQPSEVEVRLAALKQLQAARRAEIDKQRIDLIARHLSERDGLRALHESENTGVVSARLQKQPKGILAFLTRITGIQMITDARYRRQDERRDKEQKEQAEALKRRHERELKETDRHYDALDRIEARENRAAATALHREEFQRIADLIRKPPGRELKPDFDRAANPVAERTGTDDSKAPQQAVAEKANQGNKQEKGKLVSLFNRFVASLSVEPPQPPAPAARPYRTEFEKSAKPPIDLTEAFNREVENRRSREERDRDLEDGLDHTFDPTDPKR